MVPAFSGNLKPLTGFSAIIAPSYLSGLANKNSQDKTLQDNLVSFFIKFTHADSNKS